MAKAKTAAKPAKKSAAAKVVDLTPMKTILAEMEQDVEKFNNGTSAAGVRLRKGAMNLRNLCKELRNLVTEIKTARKGK